jgi:hypothetical protein
MIGAITAGLFSTGTVASTNSYESIATVTLASASATITFSSIPNTYKHLQIRGIGRTSNAVTDENIVLQFNSDTTSNYSTHWLNGNGSTASGNVDTPFTKIPFARTSGASSGANIFGVTVCDILDYADTNKYKTVRALSGHDENGSGVIQLRSGFWRSTSAITTITIQNDSVANMAQYSSFALYGIKG